MLLTGGCMVAEVVGGVLAGSLALIADAGHMLTDTAALALAWAAFRVGHWPQDARRSYGYHRFQVLAAFVNSLGLIAIAGWIAIEAGRRLLAPVEVQGGLMLAIAGLGLLVNLAAFALRRGDPENLNIQGAILHVLGDLLGSIGAIVAALVIIWTGWTPIDPLLSLAVACSSCAAGGCFCADRRTSCWRARRTGLRSTSCARRSRRRCPRSVISTTCTPGC
jgi:cobalt-zinc-cadmium efflux system protein